MKEMKTLTIGDTTYEVVDEKAREEANKANSWNNLTDKPFSKKEEEFLASTLCNFSYGSAGLSHDALINGDTYLVIFDGTEYVCKAIAGQMDGADVVVAGNINVVIELGFVCDSTELPQNNEPFVIATEWIEDTLYSGVITCLDDMDVESSTHTVGIKHLIVKTLDEKYLPKDAIVSWIDEYMEKALGGEF